MRLEFQIQTETKSEKVHILRLFAFLLACLLAFDVYFTT